jgi:hypothetical protein
LEFSSKIDLESYGRDTTILVCPRCGFNYLHQGCVTVYDRSEDERTTRVVEVANGSATLSNLPSDNAANPSSRRHGLAISFSCEGCGGGTSDDIIELTVAQHKGQTVVAWRFDPIPPKSTEDS